MKTKVACVDLTPLRKLTNKIDPNEPVELKIIEHYSYYVTNEINTIESFTNYLLSQRYFKVDSYPYNELRTFYNTKRYLNIVLKFIGFIDYLVMKEIGCMFENVKFSKVLEDNEKLLIEMEVSYGE